MTVNFDNELDWVLKLNSHHPCYKHWKQYHLNDLMRGANIAQFLASRLPLQSAVVLDMGCGLGGISIAVSQIAARVIGIENVVEFVKFAERRAREMGRTNAEFTYGTAEALPIATASMDLVLMNDVIEHFAEPSRAIAETARVLKVGGHVYVLAPNRHSLSVTLRDPHYKLPFVVWLPQRWRDFWIRILGRGDRYDGNWFPSMPELIDAFARVGIELAPVGSFDYQGPRIRDMNIFKRFLWGYPVYMGTKTA
jgi:SAM-dependent methyltransferase